ncbi:MAG: response regulator [Chloroflexota bacterium]
MASLPRIITVDPTGSIPQQIRAAFDLMDRLVVQIDVPGPQEAVEELQRGGIDLVIAAWNLSGTQGWELAAKLKQINENVDIMLMGDYEDTELDDEMLEQSPFVYLKRPFNIPQLINVLQASLDGGDIFAAVNASTTELVSEAVELGPVPTVNADKADEVMQGVMFDINPIAAMLATRDGDIVVGRTTMGDVDYEYIARLIGSTAQMNINMRDVIGGNLQTLQFFDGSDYDVYVLSVGLHHFLTLVFDGKEGASQIGTVKRYGGIHAENLIAVIGPAAFLVQRVAPEPEAKEVRRKSERTKAAVTSTQEIEKPELARADLGGSSSEEAKESEAPAAPQRNVPQMEAISDDDFDPAALFGGDFDDAAADDLFSLEALENLPEEDNQGTVDWDTAVQLGVLDDK